MKQLKYCLSCKEGFESEAAFPKCPECKKDNALADKPWYLIPTPNQWSQSVKGGPFFQTSEFKGIATALGRFNKVRLNDNRALEELQKLFGAITLWCDKKNLKYGNTSKGLKTFKVNNIDKQFVHASEKDKWQRSKRGAVVGDLIEDAINAFYLVVYLKQREWSGVTAPNFGDLSQYNIIINGVAEYKDGDPPYITAMLKTPETIVDACPSVSYITHAVNPMFAPSGFILDVPKECFFAARSGDIGTPSFISISHDAAIFEQLVKFYREKGLISPADVLQGMRKDPLESQKYDWHNELFLLGKGRGMNSKKSIQIVAIFVIGKMKKGNVIPEKYYEIVGKQIRKNKKGTPIGMTQIVKPVPAVSQKRMEMYKKISEKLDISIVALKIGDQTKPETACQGNWSPWRDNFVLQEN